MSAVLLSCTLLLLIGTALTGTTLLAAFYFHNSVAGRIEEENLVVAEEVVALVLVLVLVSFHMVEVLAFLELEQLYAPRSSRGG